MIVAVILFYYGSRDLKDSETLQKECNLDSDCVPAWCCHSNQCISKNNAPNCTGIFCTAVCSGPLDCKAGHCGCINGKCVIVKN